MRRVLIGLASVGAGSLAVILCVWLLKDRGLEPLTSAPAPITAAALPGDSVVAHLKDAAGVAAPFVVQPTDDAVDGTALAAPEGSLGEGAAGRAALAFAAPRAGKYSAWVRTWWRDACGNSIDFLVDDQPGRVVQDQVFSTWHWVKAGAWTLAAGPHRLTVLPREDGLALDQVLFTPDADFLPTGPIESQRAAVGVRRFGDDFARSPGHGLGEWNPLSGEWKIEFSFDPNRIPNQYALVGRADQDKAAVALVKGSAWRGCRLSFSFMALAPGRCGAVFDADAAPPDAALRVGLEHDGKTARAVAAGAPLPPGRNLGDAVGLNQWHRVVIERWGPRLWMAIDGREALSSCALPARAGAVGLFVDRGAAVFDDVQLEELLWREDDGRDAKLPWQVGVDAKWFRSTRPDAAVALIGRGGVITLPAGPLPVAEVVVEPDDAGRGAWSLSSPGLHEADRADGARIFRAALEASTPPAPLTLSVTNGEARLRRIAVAWRRPMIDVFRIGPYLFSEAAIDDPSDYLDFTPEEYARMQKSPDADKLRRQLKRMPLIGSGANGYAVWIREGGRWQVGGGVLAGAGPGATLRYSQAVVNNYDLRLKVRLTQPGTSVEVELYHDDHDATSGARVRLAPQPPTAASGDALDVRVPADGRWHHLLLHADAVALEASLDGGAPQRATLPRREGGELRLHVPAGRAEFDDIELTIPREQPRGRYYAFDRRECDWRREGGRWIDHGGITCALASHWVSLEAAAGEGVLWNRLCWGPNVLLAFNVEENTKWFGWHHPGESHEHYPFDNIRALLSCGRDIDRGYRLEVNSRERTMTVLYRNGKEVASVRQDGSFPMVYRGGHSPWSPRKNRVELVKRDGLIRALVNGREVLRYDDPEPLPVDSVGLGGYRTHINFSHIEVRRLSGDEG